VPRRLREENTPGDSDNEFGTLDVGRHVPAIRTESAHKHQVAGKATLRREDDDRSLGLWINKDMFRRHQQQQARIILHNPRASTNNRYLALADVANHRKQSTSKNANNVDAKHEDAKHEDAKNAGRIR
jgi:hypothetical protein